MNDQPILGRRPSLAITDADQPRLLTDRGRYWLFLVVEAAMVAALFGGPAAALLHTLAA